MAKPAISVQNVSKKFKYWSERPHTIKDVLVDMARGRFSSGKKTEFWALREVSFDIHPGEFVGIMGRNGAGKSTMLKLISGIYAPSSGRIEVNGSIAPMIELGAGFHPDLSGYENVFLNASIMGFGRKAAQAALPEILDFADLGDKIYMPTKNYSTGMLVRLGFAVATHLAAPTILVDEVLAVGDAGFQQKCLNKIDALTKEGRTIILITHSPESVRQHCNRCIVIDQQHKVYDGEPEAGITLYENAVNAPHSRG